MGKKSFGSVAEEVVATPVSEHKKKIEETRTSLKSSGKFKIKLDDGNATKRTFYVRNDIGMQFDMYSVSHRVDKGALLNTIIKEWLEANQERTEFSQF